MSVAGPKPEWIGDVRRRGLEAQEYRAHLIVTGSAMIAKVTDEARSVLDPRRFIVHEIPPGASRGTERRINFQTVAQQAIKRDKEVLFIQSIERLVSEAMEHPSEHGPYGTGDSRFSLLHSRMVFDTIFIDKVDDFRNPTCRYFRTLRRLVAKSCVVMGVSGTPVISTQLDLFNLGRLLDFPTIVKGPSTSVHILKTHPRWGDILDGNEHVKSEFDFHNAAPAARDICSIIHRHETLMRQYYEDAQTTPGPQAMRQTSTDNASEAPPDLATCRDQFTRDVAPVIHELISPFIIRRTHSSVGYDDLPMTDHEPLRVVLEEVGLQAEELAYYVDWRTKADNLPDEDFVESCMVLNAARLYREGHFKPYEYTSASWHLLADNLLKSLQLNDKREPSGKERHIVYVGDMLFRHF